MVSIDVILCCYNQELYIEEALKSILCQKVDAKVRILVADDGSSDRTLDIIKSHEVKSSFPFVYFDSNGNIGMQANYQRAFEACNSDYIAILEGDDWWTNDQHLSQHIEFLQNHPRYSMSFNRITYYYQENGTYKLNKWPYKKDYVTIKLRHQLGWGNQIGNLSSCVLRTNLLHDLPDQFFKLKFADWELGVMMALKGPIGKLKDSTSVYRINSNGQWTSLSADKRGISENKTLDELALLIPKYCKRYIKMYRDMLDLQEQSPFMLPLGTRLKLYLKNILGK